MRSGRGNMSNNNSYMGMRVRGASKHHLPVKVRRPSYVTPDGPRGLVRGLLLRDGKSKVRLGTVYKHVC